MHMQIQFHESFFRLLLSHIAMVASGSDPRRSSVTKTQTRTSAKPWTFNMRPPPISLLTSQTSQTVGHVWRFPILATRIGFQRSYSVHPRSFDDSSGNAPRRPKVTLANLRKMYMTKQKLAVMTAYDYPSGIFADRAGSDIILVGDSLGMVCLGYESTNQVTLFVLPSRWAS